MISLLKNKKLTIQFWPKYISYLVGDINFLAWGNKIIASQRHPEINFKEMTWNHIVGLKILPSISFDTWITVKRF